MSVHEDRHVRLQEEAWPLVVLLLLTAWFFLMWFNRFAGIRSGDGEFGGGIAFLAGLRPYRDYFTAGPPLNQIKAALELFLFGKMLIVTRLAAVAERLVLAGVLYVWLRRRFSMLAALLASFVTIIVSAGDRSDPLASYNHDAILLAVLCGLAAALALDALRLRSSLCLGFCAGIAVSLSFLTKQTVGGAAAVGVLVFAAIALARLRGLSVAARWVVCYFAGIILPLAAMAFYLFRLGILRACLTMLFVSGPAAKASHPLQFLSREWMIADFNRLWVSLALIALAFSARAVWRGTLSPSPLSADGRNAWMLVLLSGSVVLAAAELLAKTSLPALQDFGKASVYYAFLGCAVLGVAALIAGWRARGPARPRLLQIALFASLSWSVAAALSLSWPAFEAMAVPGLGLLLAAAVDGARPWGRRFLYLVLAAMVFLQVREKLDVPFTFDHQDEPALRFATQPSDLPALRGMRLPRQTLRLIDDTMRSIQTHAQPGDTIFTYPEMGIFYSLSGYYPPTWSPSHNIDVVQDSLARADAARLLRSHPAVILYARPSEANQESDEHLWREGHRSGQRAIVAALDQMVQHYQLVGTYRLTPEDNIIRLYVRPLTVPAPDRPAPARESRPLVRP